jgi:hypothetical protein
MRKPILLRHHLGTWSHPYGAGPFDPYLYADGGDGDGSGSTSDDAAKDDGAAADDKGGGANDGGAAEDAAKPTDTKPDTGKGAADEGQAAKVARLEKELKAANAEAGKARTDAKKQAADEARSSIVQELGKALGLIQDDKDTPPDPAKLTAEIERAKNAHRETAIELAVFKGASKHSADPGSLTDSRSFMAQLGKLDPAADDFAKKVSDAIKKAVEDNPKLKTGSIAAAAAVSDFTGGDGQPDKATPADDIDKIRAARRKRRAG